MSIEQTAPRTWAGHARGSTEYGRLLAALFCAGIATFAQLYSPQAVLPLISADLHIGAADAALMVSASTIGLAVGVIPWSTLADRIGRVRAISLSVTIATAVGLLVPFAPTYQLLLAGRFVEGLVVGGVPAIAVAYLTEEIDPKHAARAAGTFVAGTTIGGLMGRLVSSPVAEALGWRMGVFTVAVLCGVAALSFVKVAPRPRGFVPSRWSGHPEGGLGHRLTMNLRSPRQLALFALAFLLMGGFVAMYNFLGFRLVQAPFYLSPFVVSLVFLAYLAGTWSSSRAGAEASRFGRKPVLLVSIAVMIAGVAITLSDNVFAVLVRSGGRDRGILRRPFDRIGVDRTVGADRQGSGLVAVQPVLLRRLERRRLVRRRGLRRRWLDCRRRDHPGAGRRRRRRRGASPAE